LTITAAETEVELPALPP
jgi:hypothetical protein